MSDQEFADPMHIDATFAGTRGGPEWSDRLAVTRSGPREPIRAAVRFVVHCRDNWRCRWCGFMSSPTEKRGAQHLEADHIMPWSAGGSDRSDNLRSLCNVCNQDRSNFRTDSDHARAKPCVLHCSPCTELLHRYGADLSRVELVDPWKLRMVIPTRGEALEQVGDFEMERPSDPIFVFCYWGTHNSWTDSERHIL